MTEQPPPPPPPPTPGPPAGGPPPPAGVPRPAELMDRFLARLIDGLVVGIPMGIVYGILSSIILTGIVYSRGEIFLFWIFFSLIYAAVAMAYFAYFESSRGATVGKQVLKLKVVG